MLTCFFSMTRDMWACSAAFICEKSIVACVLCVVRGAETGGRTNEGEDGAPEQYAIGAWPRAPRAGCKV